MCCSSSQGFPAPTMVSNPNLQPQPLQVTWGDYGSGFTAAPGGEAYANRTVMTYHFYEPPQMGAEGQINSHVKEVRCRESLGSLQPTKRHLVPQAMRLGTAAMLTETESLWALEALPSPSRCAARALTGLGPRRGRRAKTPPTSRTPVTMSCRAGPIGDGRVSIARFRTKPTLRASSGSGVRAKRAPGRLLQPRTTAFLR